MDQEMASPNPWMIVPFALLLAANWWSRHYSKVALGLGAIIANVLGTTGAAMLLIRLQIRAAVSAAGADRRLAALFHC